MLGFKVLQGLVPFSGLLFMTSCIYKSLTRQALQVPEENDKVSPLPASSVAEGSAAASRRPPEPQRVLGASLKWSLLSGPQKVVRHPYKRSLLKAALI